MRSILPARRLTLTAGLSLACLTPVILPGLGPTRPTPLPCEDFGHTWGAGLGCDRNRAGLGQHDVRTGAEAVLHNGHLDSIGVEDAFQKLQVQRKGEDVGLRQGLRMP